MADASLGRALSEALAGAVAGAADARNRTNLLPSLLDRQVRDRDREQADEQVNIAAAGLVREGLFSDAATAAAAIRSGTVDITSRHRLERKARTKAEALANARLLGITGETLTPEVLAAMSAEEQLEYYGASNERLDQIFKSTQILGQYRDDLMELRSIAATPEEFEAAAKAMSQQAVKGLGGLHPSVRTSQEEAVMGYLASETSLFARDHHVRNLGVSIAGYQPVEGVSSMDELRQLPSQHHSLAEPVKALELDAARLDTMLGDSIEPSVLSPEVAGMVNAARDAGGFGNLSVAQIQEARKKILPLMSDLQASSKEARSALSDTQSAQAAARNLVTALRARRERGGVPLTEDAQLDNLVALIDDPNADLGEVEKALSLVSADLIRNGSLEDMGFLEEIHAGNTALLAAIRAKRRALIRAADQEDAVIAMSAALNPMVDQVSEFGRGLASSLAARQLRVSDDPLLGGERRSQKDRIFALGPEPPPFYDIVGSLSGYLGPGIIEVQKLRAELEEEDRIRELSRIESEAVEAEAAGLHEEASSLRARHAKLTEEFAALGPPSEGSTLDLNAIGALALNVLGHDNPANANADLRNGLTRMKLLDQQTVTLISAEGGWDENLKYEDRWGMLRRLIASNVRNFAGVRAGNASGNDAIAVMAFLEELERTHAALSDSLAPMSDMDFARIRDVPELRMGGGATQQQAFASAVMSAALIRGPN